jgi:glutathione synthase/RimK-type ligase-like ATP-grasp enzyme
VRIVADGGPVAVPTGMAALTKLAMSGADMAALGNRIIARLGANPADPAALMDLSMIALLGGQRDYAHVLQARALAGERLYRRPATTEGVRLLAFMAPGDFMSNTPLEFVLDGTDVRLDMLFVRPGEPPPASVPDHDVAIAAVGESSDNQPLLAALESLLRDWPRPVINEPNRIARLSRDGVANLLKDAPGILIPATVRIGRPELERIGAGALPVAGVLGRGDFPVIVRPISSHAGSGLQKLDEASAIAAYLADHPEPLFYMSPFVDYRGADGFFRKYRVALIDGRSFASHAAISRNWMVHYLNAGMSESAEKRAEEARWMAEFDAPEGFAARHATALRGIAERLGLDYVTIDCGEAPDGRLLVFEADVAGIVHAMDPPDLFPYKGPAMRKLFAGFRAMLCRRAGRG